MHTRTNTRTPALISQQTLACRGGDSASGPAHPVGQHQVDRRELVRSVILAGDEPHRASARDPWRQSLKLCHVT